MKMVKRFFALIFVFQFMIFSLYAQDYNPLRKIARGTVNLSLGWTEIFRQTIKVTEEKGDIAGIFWGPLKGLTFALGRTTLGVCEIATFIFPPYRALVEPEFIFSEGGEE
jgi:putative exosortase-associated protein (TIGR04073 family)